MLKKIRNRQYEKMLKQHPKAMRVYLRYKLENSEFHVNNKNKSLAYMFRLIRAEKENKNLYEVKMPKGIKKLIPPAEKLEAQELVRSKAISDAKLINRPSVEEFVDMVSKYDVISFDVFDTLIFRPFAKPTDLFYLLQNQLECFDFQDLRIQAEVSARNKTKKPNFEVDIYDIYAELENYCHLKRENACDEIELEKEVCYANPYLLEVYRNLLSLGKKIIVTSDMYLPRDVIEAILSKNGYSRLDDIFVSNEHGFNKASGKLFEVVKKKYSGSIIHIGDSYEADIAGSKKAKIASYHYKQCNEFGNKLRPASLISPVSSIYKGIVNNYLYNGTATLTPRECFGFIYAGPVVVGMCDWLNSFCSNEKLDKILFLARDMAVFHKVYNEHFKEFDNTYTSTSRFSLQELIVEDYPAEFFHHTIKARCDRGYTIKEALHEINLDFLAAKCKSFSLNENDIITGAKISKLENMFFSCKSEIVEHFKDNEAAAIQYFKEQIGSARRLCLVDLGWRGSILAYLKFLLVKKWRLCDEVKGVLLGTTVNNTSISLISEGIVTPYAYSHLKNRGFLSGSNWETEYIRILALESVFSSAEPSLIEYRLNKETQETELFTYKSNPNKPIVEEFHRGIVEFAKHFETFRSRYKQYYPISEVDAFEAIFNIATNYEYVARIIGDVVDTPFAIAGLNIDEMEYVPLGELMLQRNLISKWPI